MQIIRSFDHFIYQPHTEKITSFQMSLVCASLGHGGGGGSSIVKVPRDVPPARVCFFKPSSLAKGILFANFRPFSLGKGILFANFGQRNVKLR